jgi:hypothetical protein
MWLVAIILDSPDLPHISVFPDSVLGARVLWPQAIIIALFLKLYSPLGIEPYISLIRLHRLESFPLGTRVLSLAFWLTQMIICYWYDIVPLGLVKVGR